LAVGLLVTEAGGMITDWQGNPLGMENDTNIVAAASPELHEQLLALLTD
jgi:fructose-1,6-bisphosphatase/inositol monophosphatase family enzyme